MSATYTKLRDGSWGVKIKGFIPDQGVSVNVTKRNGETKREFINRIVWNGKEDGLPVAICSLQTANRGESRQPRNIGEIYKRRYGWDGVRGSPSYYSSGMYDEES